jgi:hypothetical protein
VVLWVAVKVICQGYKGGYRLRELSSQISAQGSFGKSHDAGWKLSQRVSSLI